METTYDKCMSGLSRADVNTLTFERAWTCWASIVLWCAKGLLLTLLAERMKRRSATGLLLAAGAGAGACCNCLAPAAHSKERFYGLRRPHSHIWQGNLYQTNIMVHINCTIRAIKREIVVRDSA